MKELEGLIKEIKLLLDSSKFQEDYKLIRKIYDNLLMIQSNINVTCELIELVEIDIKILSNRHTELRDIVSTYSVINDELKKQCVKNDNCFEIEETLAKLYFYIKIAILDKEYSFCKDKYQEILNILDNWISIYSKDKSLVNIKDKDIKKAQALFYSISFADYKGFYYFEYIDAELSKVKFYKKRRKNGNK